ncbi:MAG TPA: hypothetical protein VL595_11680 [Pseudonocardia sp.]|jgi:hypothetical protein|nr:hypothetical protein [Pseudonocardia sp.]
MTRKRAAKRAAREAAARTGRSYTDARSPLDPRGSGQETPILARGLNQRILTRFRAAGWPVEAEPVPREGRWLSYPGPVQLALSRASRDGGGWGEGDPDDEIVHDLSVAPALHVSFPMLLTAGGAGVVDEEWDCASGASGVVSRVDRRVGRARGDAITLSQADDICGVCEDEFPAAHLLAPTDSDALRVCPSCVFDGDVVWPADPARLALGIDRLHDVDAAAPAGWAAVGALLSCARRHGVRTPLLAQLRSAGILFEPARAWANPSWWWIWLPDREQRPPALAGFGVGASLGAIVREIERIHPHLPELVLARDHAIDAELDWDSDDLDDGGLRREMDVATLRRCWPAIIAYVVAFTTQDHDRSHRRGPWHLLDSFDALAEHFDVLESDLTFGQVERVLDVAIPVVASELGVAELR